MLSIADDGVGFDSTQKVNGIGLSNIVSRAAIQRSCQLYFCPWERLQANCSISARIHKLRAAPYQQELPYFRPGMLNRERRFTIVRLTK